jgi:hypothetical protein
MFSERITECTNLVATIQTKNATGSYYSDAISLASNIGRRYVAYVSEGTIGSSGTVDFQFQWSATSGGTYATITGTAMAQDTVGGKTFMIETNTEQVISFAPTATYMKGYLKTLVAATPTSVIILATEMDYKPCTQSAANAGATITIL